MQLHMFWALFLHAQDTQDIADDPERGGSLGRPDSTSASCSGHAVQGRPNLAAGSPTLEKTLFDYYTRGGYDEFWSRKSTTSPPLGRARDIPGTYWTGWYDLFPTPTPSTSRRWREEHDAAAAGRRPVDPHRHRGDAT